MKNADLISGGSRVDDLPSKLVASRSIRGLYSLRLGSRSLSKCDCLLRRRACTCGQCDDKT